MQQYNKNHPFVGKARIILKKLMSCAKKYKNIFFDILFKDILYFEYEDGMHYNEIRKIGQILGPIQMHDFFG